MTATHDVPGVAVGRQDPIRPRDAERDEIGEIQDTIEETRVRMSETIGELQERLSPAHIKAQIREATIGKVENMAQRASDTMYEARQSLVSTVTSNPMPAALVGIGLAWLWMNRRNGGSVYDARRSQYDGGVDRRYSDEWSGRFEGQGATRNERPDRSEAGLAGKAGDAISDAGERISGMVGQVRDAGSQLAARTKDRVSGVVDQAQQTAERVKASAQNQAQHAQDRFNRAMDENPLAVGAIALAVGTAIGLAIPQTRKENEWMGEARDSLVDTAQEAVHNATGQMKEAARNPSGPASGNGEMSESWRGGA